MDNCVTKTATLKSKFLPHVYGIHLPFKFFNCILLISWHTITNIALVLIIKKCVCNMSILYFGQYPNSIWSRLTTFKFTQRSSLHWNGLIFQNQVLYRTSFYQGLKTKSISKSSNLIYKMHVQFVFTCSTRTFFISLSFLCLVFMLFERKSASL